jgi:hypothetical protein
MNNNKTKSYLISAAVLIFLSLKDLDNFNIFYEGIGLALGITALALAGIEYKRKIHQENK